MRRGRSENRLFPSPVNLAPIEIGRRYLSIVQIEGIDREDVAIEHDEVAALPASRLPVVRSCFSCPGRMMCTHDHVLQRQVCSGTEAERTTGSLEAGKRGDFIVLDRDIFAIDPFDLHNTQVTATYLDGRQVYTAKGKKTIL